MTKWIIMIVIVIVVIVLSVLFVIYGLPLISHTNNILNMRENDQNQHYDWKENRIPWILSQSRDIEKGLNTLSFVNKTIVINLERRTDRKQELLDKWPWVSYKPEFFKAVDGSTIHNFDDMDTWLSQWSDVSAKKLFGNNNFGNRRSVMACAASHYLLWNKIAHENNNVLVLEDDARPYLDSYSIWSKISQNGLPNDFDIIYVGQGGKDPQEYKIFDKRLSEYGGLISNQHFRNINKVTQSLFDKNPNVFWTALSIVISPKGAKKLVNIANTEGIHCAIDHWLVHNWKKLNVYTTREWVFFASVFQNSDIQFDKNSIF